MHRLKLTQLSKRLLAIRAVTSLAAERFPGAVVASDLAGSYEVLAAAQRRSPTEVGDLLVSPTAGLWASHCLRCLGDPEMVPARLSEDLAGLGVLAVAAAHRAGLDTEVTVLVRDGGLVLPTLGRLQTNLSGWVRARTAGGLLGLSTRDAPEGDPIDVAAPRQYDRWRPVRRLTSESDGQRIDLVLDDLDPARTFLDLPMSASVVTDLADQWQLRLNEGWRILNHYDRELAAALAAGLSTVFPLDSTEQAAELSASSGEAFGAVAMTLPQDGLSCASALIHEFQHNKLSALLDLVTLFENTEGKLFYAPWRRDPRPLPGLLQGAYAYLGLTDFWEFQRHQNTQTSEQYAHFEFARWREGVWRVLVALRLSESMTPLGLRFLDGMQATASSHRGAAVPREPRELARQVSTDTWLTWRLANLAPNPDAVAALAENWISGRPAPTGLKVRTETVPSARGLFSGGRLTLVQLRLSEPKLFRAAREGVPDVLDERISLGDQAHAFGDYTLAAEAYKDELSTNPDRVEAWAGLALSRRWRPTTGSDLLLSRPEVVLALHRRIEALSGTRVDPDRLTAWLPTTAPPARTAL